eukprot:6658999-Pyramimonas_sp.AAC.2
MGSALAARPPSHAVLGYPSTAREVGLPWPPDHLDVLCSDTRAGHVKEASPGLLRGAHGVAAAQ